MAQIDAPTGTAITVTISRSGDDAVLSWLHDSSLTSYSVWSSTDPYFLPGDPGASLLATLPPPASGNTLVFTDTGAISDTSTNSYYVISAIDALSEISLSNTIGEFVSLLSPGWNLLSWPLPPITTTLDAAIGDQLFGSENPTTADRVLVWNGVSQSYDSAWFCGGPVCESWGEPWADHWLANDYSHSPLTLPPDMGFWVQNRSGSTETLVIVGEVAHLDRDVAINPSWQLLGMAFPAGRELDKANLPATGTENPTTADRVLVWDPASQSYQSAWFCGGPVCESWGEPWANHWLANDYSPTDISISPGQGFWLQNRHLPFSWPNLRPAPDLQIAMDDGGFPALPGMTLQYRLTYSNTGNLSALGVVVSDTLPANTSFNPSASSPGWVQVGVTDAYTYTAGMLDMGASGVVTYAVTVDSPLPPGTVAITNTAVITETGYRGLDPNLADNQDGVSTLLSSGQTEVCGTISADTTWIMLASPYVINCDIVINQGVSLLIEPGTIIKFSGPFKLFVRGSLSSIGTAVLPIIFTSILDDSYGGDTNNDGTATSPAPGNWQGLYFASTSTGNILDHTIVRYGGNFYFLPNHRDYAANTACGTNHTWSTIYVDAGSLTLTNSTISHGQGVGLNLYAGTVTVNGNTISNFLSGDPDLGGSCGQMHYYGYGIFGYYPTSLDITNNVFASNANDGIHVSNGVPVSIANNSINAGGDYAIYLQNARLSPSSGENIATANRINGIGISATIASNTNLPHSNLPYVIENLTINSSVIVTLTPGQVIKFLSSARLVVQGTLSAQGSIGNNIVFTSLLDDSYGGDTNNDGAATSPSPGNWQGLYFASTSTGNILDHTIVRYGGNFYFLPNHRDYAANTACGTNHTWSTIYVDAGSLTLTNSTISHGQGVGLNLYAGTVTINGNTISNFFSGDPNLGGSCGQMHYYGYGVFSYYSSFDLIGNLIQNNFTGVYVQNNSTVNLTNNSITLNSNYGMYNTNSLVTQNAINNWWGHSTGPYHQTQNPGGMGNRVSDYIAFRPWEGIASNYGQSIPWQYYEADPVNTATGNYAYEHTDLSIPTRSLPIEFTRSYNSSNPQLGNLGYGWSHSYMVSVTENSTDGTVTLRHGDGREERFTWTGAAYIPPAGSHSILEKIGVLFRLTTKEQTVYNFDSLGRLSSITDRIGNQTTLSYAGALLDAIIAPDGRALTFSYNADSRLSQVTDPVGRSLEFGYEPGGDLAVFTDTMNVPTSYTYDADHRMLSVTDGNGHTFVTNTYNTDGRVSQQRDAQNNLTTFFYEISNRRTTVTNPRGYATIYQYDSELRLVSVRDALNYTETYIYDADNNQTSVKDKRDNTTFYAYDLMGNILAITDNLGYIQTFTYDAQNNLLTATDANQHTTTHTYDSAGNRLTTTDVLGNITTYTYYADIDRKGRLASQTDPRGYTTTYDYNPQGDLTLVTDALNGTVQSSYDLGGCMLSQTDARGFTTSYTYDDANRLLSVEEPLGKVTTYDYDLVGNLVHTTDPLGHTITNIYDTKDRLVNITDAAGYVITHTYDSVGNRITTTDGNGHTTDYTYDELDRLSGMTNPLNQTTTFTYDANGNRTGVTDPLSHTSTYIYDALNRQTQVIDALNNTSTTAHDPVGNILSVSDANNHTTSYTYDAVNHLQTVTDALNGTVTYGYDANGNRISMTDANSHTTTYTYDERNRLSSVTDTLGNTTTHGYDANGNRTSTLDANEDTIGYTYDALNRLTDITYSGGGGSVSYSYDAAGNRLTMVDSTGTTSYTYDELNHPLSITSQQGAVSYTYDAINRRSVTTPAGTTTYTYDAADRLYTVQDWLGSTTSYTFDAAGRQTGISYPNGTTATYTYDIANRLTSVTYNMGGTALETFSYTLDNVGNRLSMTDADGVTSYTYDNLYRLTGVSYPTGLPALVSYTYDPMGNRLGMTQDGVSTDYTYDAADRLLSTDTGGVVTTFSWDNNGNMLTKGSETFTWDALNRMVGWTDGTNTASYSYNGDGVRLGKSVDGVTTAYFQDLAAGLPVVLQETTGGATLDFIYGLDLISQVEGTEPSYYHTDGLGSTRLLTDGSGSVTDRYSYDAFGTSRDHTGTSDQAFTYTGEQFDPETGLIYLRSRSYSSEYGRFVSRDTALGSSAFPSTWNYYVYTYNNPNRWIDPIGMWGLSPRVNLGATGGILGSASISGGIGPELEFPSWNLFEWRIGVGVGGTGKTKLGPHGEFGPEASVSVYVWDRKSPIPGAEDLEGSKFCGGGSGDVGLGISGGVCTGGDKTGVEASLSAKPGAGASGYLSAGIGKSWTVSVGDIGSFVGQTFDKWFGTSNDNVAFSAYGGVGGGGGGGGAGGDFGSPPGMLK